MSKELFKTKLSQTQDETNSDRIEIIYEETKTLFNREIENLQMQLKEIGVNRKSLLDFRNDGEIIKPEDFKPKEFVRMDIELSLQEYNLNQALQVVKDRYKSLFK